jgi:pimeloyl-ACP methyl ester carboxylesterase
MRRITPGSSMRAMMRHVAAQPTIGDYARCVVEVTDALRVGRFVALGEAVGAFVATALATAYPDRIERLVAGA